MKVNCIRRGNYIIEDRQCGFLRHWPATGHIFCICQTLGGKKWENNEAVHKLFIDLMKSYDSVRRAVLYNILIEFGISLKLVRLIKICLNETYSRVGVGSYLSDMFSVKSVFKKKK